MNLKKLFVSLLLLILLPVFMYAQTIDGGVKQKTADQYVGFYRINGEKGKTYSVELWVSAKGSKDFQKVNNITGKTGPGLSNYAENEISFIPESIPAKLGSDLVFRYKLIPESENIWSEDYLVTVENEGMNADWFGDNLINNRYLTFGIMSTGEKNGYLSLNFMITNMHSGNIDIVWNRDRALMLRIITDTGVEKIIYSGNLWFNGVSRGQYGSYTLPAGTTIEGSIVVPYGVSHIESITMGTFEFNLPNRGISEYIRLGTIK